MLNLLNPKKMPRMSRFSQNVNPDIFKSLQKPFQRQQSIDLHDPFTTNSIDSICSSRESLFAQEKSSSSMKSGRNRMVSHFLDVEEEKDRDQQLDLQKINRLKLALGNLPFLENKTRKQKIKEVDMELLEHLFQIMKEQPKFQRLRNSFVPQEMIIGEFIQLIRYIHSQEFRSSQMIQISRDHEEFFILIDGAAERSLVKEVLAGNGHNGSPAANTIKTLTTQMADRQIRTSTVNSGRRSTNLSECSVRRSKLKNKTVNEKGKIQCFEKHIPVLVNEDGFTSCTLKTLGYCNFLLIDKYEWTRFTSKLSKLQEKYLVSFISKVTTINLNVYTAKENPSNKNNGTKKSISSGQKKREQQEVRKTFLHDMRRPSNRSSEQQEQKTAAICANIIRKTTAHTATASNSYVVLELKAQESLVMDNSHVYVLTKGSVLIDTRIYKGKGSTITGGKFGKYCLKLSEGSILNSCLLLCMEQSETICAKFTEKCTIVKLLLEEIYFKKTDEIQFINRLKDIETYRVNVYGSIQKPLSKEYDLKKLQELIPQVKWNVDSSWNQESNVRDRNNGPQFQPESLRIRQINFSKGNCNKEFKKKAKKQRISCHKNKTEGSPCKSTNGEQEAKRIALKFANNYCVFEKIIQGQEKVVQKNNLNRVKKLFPIQALLKSLEFKKRLQVSRDNTHVVNKQNSKNKKIVNFEEKSQDTVLDKQQKEISKSNNRLCRKVTTQRSIKDAKAQKSLRESRVSKKSSAYNMEKMIDRRKKYLKTRLERRKNQKGKIIQNLFELNIPERPMTNPKICTGCNIYNCDKQNLPDCRKNKGQRCDYHRQGIKYIMNRTTKKKLIELYREDSFLGLTGEQNYRFEEMHPEAHKLDCIARLQNNRSVQEPKDKELDDRSKYRKQLIETEPCQEWQNSETQRVRASQMEQSASQTALARVKLSENFKGLKRKQTKRILACMMGGRIRKSCRS